MPIPPMPALLSVSVNVSFTVAGFLVAGFLGFARFNASVDNTQERCAPSISYWLPSSSEGLGDERAGGPSGDVVR